jgi:hypothetical protein
LGRGRLSPEKPRTLDQQSRAPPQPRLTPRSLPTRARERGVAYMLNPFTYPAADDSAVRVREDELLLGVPTVRLELDFVEDSASGRLNVGK